MTTVRGVNPATGEEVLIVVRAKKDGTVVLQELPASMRDPDLMSPDQLEAIARFAEASASAYGQRTTGDLPASAERVRAVMRGTGKPFHTRPERDARQAQLRSYLAPEVLELATALEKANPQGKITVTPRRVALPWGVNPTGRRLEIPPLRF